MKKVRAAAARRAFVIREPRQIVALTSPRRQAIVDAIEASGPVTIAGLGVLLQRRPSALYHHVALLLRVGLLVRLPDEPGAGRPAARYEVPGRPMKIRYSPAVARTRPAMRRVVSAMLAAASAEFAEGYAPATTVDGPARSLWAARMEGWLTEAELRRLNALLERVRDLMHERAGSAPPSARAHSLTFVLAPRRTRVP